MIQNNKNNKKDINATLLQLEELFSLSRTDGMGVKLEQYIDLLLEWNRFAGLISKADEEHILSHHIVDSLSLVPYVSAVSSEGVSSHLDIGAGGGFPSVPLAIACPGIEVVAMERSARKSTFLRKVVSELSVSNLRIIPGNFPEKVPDRTPSTVTARAVDNPVRVLDAILDWLPSNCIFLCQFPNPQERLPEGFECTSVDDAWTEKGYRRGVLHLIRPRE